MTIDASEEDWLAIDADVAFDDLDTSETDALLDCLDRSVGVGLQQIDFQRVEVWCLRSPFDRIRYSENMWAVRSIGNELNFLVDYGRAVRASQRKHRFGCLVYSEVQFNM